MIHDPDLDDILLERYLAGKASDDEQAQIAAWVRADARRAVFLERLRSAFAAPETADTDASWQQMRARIQASAGTRSLDDLRQKRTATEEKAVTPSWRRTAWRVAAAVLVVAGAASVWTIGSGGTHSLDAPLGRRASVTLPDGTKLTLAPGSRAEWSRQYGAGSREVTLRGEGFFDVVHDSARPFRVRARDGVAEDVGTRFTVRAWPELERVEVTVDEGIVSLSDSGGEGRSAKTGTLLHAGERGRLAPNGTVAVNRDSGASLAWLRGELVFEDTPVSEALPALERWYAVTIRADPALVSRRVSARFANSPLPELLDALALALDARVVRDGVAITLVPMQP